MRPSLALALLLGATGCASEQYARLYASQEKAPSYSWDDIAALDHMGPTMVDGGVNFATFSARAERIDLLIFEDPESDLPTREFPMTREGDVWNVFVEGIGVGTHYGYRAFGPNWPYSEAWFPGSTEGFLADVDAQGNRFNPNKLLTDPWGRAVHREFDWSKGSSASGPHRYKLSYAASPKSVIVQSDYEWSGNEEAWQARRRAGDVWQDNEVIYYEVHPKGLTANPASGVDHPGTFRGIGEMAPYLADLGITSLELLPIHEKPDDGGYWGYNNISFFAPELGYSAAWQTDGDPREVIDEFKWMVDQLHQYEIEVVIDVVYNHTGEGGLWREKLFFEEFSDAYEVNFDPKEVAGIYNMRGLDNWSWYALSPDGQTYWNNTGVGNQTRPNNTPMEHLIMDSLLFMVEELHVDGFRFDLAGILGEPDLDYNDWVDPAETVLQQIIDHPTMQERNIRIVAEPWTAAGSGPGIGGFPNSSDVDGYGWGEWNAHFRDWWRSFVNDDGWALNSVDGLDGGAVMTGSYDLYAWNGRKPTHSINLVTVHDGFTMYDLMSYSEKQNGCGLLNPICCDDPTSAWCDDDSGEDHNRSRNWSETYGDEGEAVKRQMMRNLFTALMISHGTPLIYGGDEWMRTQYGNNNAYSTWADNEWNWFRWGEWQSTFNKNRYRMHDFVRNMTRFRLDHAYAFAPSEYGGGMPFSWKTADNGEMQDADWSGRAIMVHYYDDGGGDYGPELAVLINMNRDDTTFTLPGGRQWAVVVDTQRYYDLPGDPNESDGWFSDNPDADPTLSRNVTPDAQDTVGTTYTVKGSSIVIVEQR
ncbi:MAG: glycosyl hydrolase [Alphaproteobacteria bacterium]|nr:glycosyl hydrolase [Alphaproteobacteria bacterium]